MHMCFTRHELLYRAGMIIHLVYGYLWMAIYTPISALQNALPGQQES